jgi:NAD(P)-dependent dehydrogenase (short-subunit alcohol dehydrogenase family)
MKVVLTARRKDKLDGNITLIKEFGGEAATFVCDVSSPKSLADAFSFAEETYGGIDFVFANAGIEGAHLDSPLVEQDDHADIQMVCDINIVGAIQTLKNAVKVFEKRGGGTIAFTSSILAFYGHAQQAATSSGMAPGSVIPYTTSKAAVDMLAEAAHGSYGEQGIKVYNFNIAHYESEMAARLGRKEESTHFPFNPIRKERLGNPIHIAEVLLAILNGSSKWPAGSALVLDNDITFHAKHFVHTRMSPGAPEYSGLPSPAELKPFAMDVKGEPYKFEHDL